MKIIEGKTIVTKSVWSTPEVKQCFEEDSFDRAELKIIPTVFLFLFNKRFRWLLTETLRYALRHSECYGGNGASDVLWFRVDPTCQKAWNVNMKTGKPI